MAQSIVINVGTGGFGLSLQAIKRYAELKDIELYFEDDEQDSEFYSAYTEPKEERTDDEDSFFDVCDIKRDDPALVQTVKELGSKANPSYSRLKIVEIPDGVDWEIYENEFGHERVVEKHRKWF
jgi:hypothetical protein